MLELRNSHITYFQNFKLFFQLNPKTLNVIVLFLFLLVIGLGEPGND